MAIRTYKVTLDSKNTIAPEPVYLRQGDKTGAVVIDATLMDNGAPVSLDSLTPMFKANTADGQAVIADSTGFNIVNASSGEFTYQVPSQLGSVSGKIKIAYFSFSDSSGAQSTFNVVFVVEKAADMTQESAKDWASNLNEIIDQYNQWVNNAHSSWQDFVNKNKEIIESIDPGGTLSTEVIDARNGKNNLKTRLDDEHAQVTKQLAQTVNKGDLLINVKDYGVTGDGVTDDTVAINSVLSSYKGHTILFPKPNSFYKVTNTLIVPWSNFGTKLVFENGQRLGSGTIRVDASFPTDSPVLKILDGTVIEGLTMSGDSVGTGIEIFGTDSKWCSLTNVNICKMDIGIKYGDGAYYNSFQNVNINSCNHGLVIDGNGRSTGSLVWNGGYVSDINEKAIHMKLAGNQIDLNNVTFERNRYHVYSESGSVSLNKCYIGDSSEISVYVDGGTVVIDGKHTETIGASGSQKWISLDSTIPTYGVFGKSGKIILKNLTLLQNIHANTGIINGTNYQGMSLYSEGAIIETDNCVCLDYRQFFMLDSKQNRMEKVPNYILNGLLRDKDRIPFDVRYSGFTSMEVLNDDNGYGSSNIRFSGGDGTQSFFEMDFYAPELVGKIAYAVFIQPGKPDSSGSNNPRFKVRSGGTMVSDGSYQDHTSASYFSTGSNGAGWQIGTLNFENHKREIWIPFLVTSPRGTISYYHNNVGGATDVSYFGGFAVVSSEHFQKLCTFEDVSNVRFGINPPTNGTWKKGDKIYNQNVSTGGYMGWVCVEDGTPGTWKGFGLVEV